MTPTLSASPTHLALTFFHPGASDRFGLRMLLDALPVGWWMQHMVPTNISMSRRPFVAIQQSQDTP